MQVMLAFHRFTNILQRNHECFEIIIDGVAIIMNWKQYSSHVVLRDGIIVKYIIAIEAKSLQLSSSIFFCISTSFLDAHSLNYYWNKINQLQESINPK